MAWLFNNAAVHGWVVYEAKLWISLCGDLVEEIVAEFESHSKTLQNGKTEHQNLAVEIVHGGFESGHFGVGRARLVREAAVLIAFFMVDALPFCAVGGVALVYFWVLKLPFELLFDWEFEERFSLVCLASRVIGGARRADKCEDLIDSFLWDAMVL
jgi:hypothetical protein